MSSNFTAQYRAAEASLRAATTNDDRRAALDEMLAAIPKQEDTARIQADIKRRLARLRNEADRRGGAGGHKVHVEPEGAAQVVLLGPPNSGKSSLLGALTRARPTIADHAYSTSHPQPGMMPFEDVQIQLVDLPPVTGDHMDPWLPDVVQGADAVVMVADASTPGVLAGVEEICDRLASERLQLVGALPGDSDPRDMPLPTLLVASKADIVDAGDLEVLEELYADRFRSVRFSAKERVGYQKLKVELWRLLQPIRVYPKAPGKAEERREPVVLVSGATVLDLAERLLGAAGARLAHARVWGGKVQGQRVALDFELRDRDVVELAT